METVLRTSKSDRRVLYGSESPSIHGDGDHARVSLLSFIRAITVHVVCFPFFSGAAHHLSIEYVAEVKFWSMFPSWMSATHVHCGVLRKKLGIMLNCYVRSLSDIALPRTLTS